MVTGLKSEVNCEEQVGAIETDKGILSVYRGQRTSPAVSVKKRILQSSSYQPWCVYVRGREVSLTVYAEGI